MNVMIPEGLPTLSGGAHEPGDGRACIMEYVSLLAGEEWSDYPKCTHPTLAYVAQGINDGMRDDNRHLLVPLIGRFFGTSTSHLDIWDQIEVMVKLGKYVERRFNEIDEFLCNAVTPGTPESGYCYQRLIHNALDLYTKYRAAFNSHLAYIYQDDLSNFSENYALEALIDLREFVESMLGRLALITHHKKMYDLGFRKGPFRIDSVNPRLVDEDKVQFLTELLDEFDVIIGRTEHREVTKDELKKLSEMVSV